MKKNPLLITEKFASPTDVALAQATCYTIQGDDSGHEYFVEVGMEGEFESWVRFTEDGDDTYEGYDYEKSRINGRFTFVDPRNE